MSPPRLGDAVRVRQVLDEPTGRATCLLECARTRAAALVDPWPEHARVIDGWLAEGIKLRFELFTRPPGDTARAGAGRLDRLRSRIGLSARAVREPVGPPPPWAGLARARIEPVDRREHALRVRVGETLLCLPDDPSRQGPAYTVMGRGGADHEVEVARLRIALGAWHVEVLPCRADRPRLAYLVADRLIFGGPVRVPFGGGGEAPLPLTLLETLPPETVIYATTATEGIAVSTVTQERALAGRSTPRTVPSLDDAPLDALAGLDLHLTPLAPADRRG